MSHKITQAQREAHAALMHLTNGSFTRGETAAEVAAYLGKKPGAVGAALTALAARDIVRVTPYYRAGPARYTIRHRKLEVTA